MSAQVSVPPSFEVVSIRKARANTPFSMKVYPAQLVLRGAMLVTVIAQAYRVAPSRVWGPGWISSAAEKFDVFAKLPSGSRTDQVPEMIQAVLAERFKLSLHRVDRVEVAYGLEAVKSAHPLRPAAPDDPKYSSDRSKAVTLDELAASVSKSLDQTVTNETGLTGRYWIPLSLLTMNAEAQAFLELQGINRAPVTFESVAAAVEAVGLRLHRSRTVMPMLIVDRVEQLHEQN